FFERGKRWLGRRGSPGRHRRRGRSGRLFFAASREEQGGKKDELAPARGIPVGIWEFGFWISRSRRVNPSAPHSSSPSSRARLSPCRSKARATRSNTRY